MSEIQINQQSKIVAIGNDAQYINQQVTLGDQALISALEHYRNAGERLSQVREDVKQRGQRIKGVGFTAWIDQNCKFKRRQAYSYIYLFENWSFVQLTAQTDLKQALNQITEYKASQKQIDDEVAETVDIQATEIIDQRNKELETKFLELKNKENDLQRFDEDIRLRESQNQEVLTINHKAQQELEKLRQEIDELYVELEQEPKVIEKVTIQVDESKINQLKEVNLKLKIQVDTLKTQVVDKQDKLRQQAESYEKKLTKQIKAYEALLKPTSVLTDDELRVIEGLHHDLKPEMSRGNFEQIVSTFIQMVSNRPDLFTYPETEYIQKIIAFMKTF